MRGLNESQPNLPSIFISNEKNVRNKQVAHSCTVGFGFQSFFVVAIASPLPFDTAEVREVVRWTGWMGHTSLRIYTMQGQSKELHTSNPCRLFVH